MSKPLLSVCLITYNHEKFVAQAIESILMQKVNFVFEIIIADDFSTDRTREIIIEYQKKNPHLIKLLLQKMNVGAAQNFIDLITSPTSKYIAYLEGDDFYTDPLKLQKQVDFLEQNSAYIICGTNANALLEATGEYEKKAMLDLENESDFDFIDIAIKHRVITGSAMFRNHNIIKNLPKWYVLAPVGDWPLFLILSQFGRVKNLNFIGVTYRKHVGGVYSHASGFKKNNITVRIYKTYIKEFNIRDRRVIENYKKYIYWTFLDAPSKAIQKEMILNYINPFSFFLFFDRSLIKMVFNFLFK